MIVEKDCAKPPRLDVCSAVIFSHVLHPPSPWSVVLLYGLSSAPNDWTTRNVSRLRRNISCETPATRRFRETIEKVEYSPRERWRGQPATRCTCPPRTTRKSHWGTALRRRGSSTGTGARPRTAPGRSSSWRPTPRRSGPCGPAACSRRSWHGACSVKNAAVVKFDRVSGGTRWTSNLPSRGFASNLRTNERAQRTGDVANGRASERFSVRRMTALPWTRHGRGRRFKFKRLKIDYVRGRNARDKNTRK